LGYFIRRLIGAAALVVSASPVVAFCADDKVAVSGDFGRATFTVEIADDNETRAQGLMFVEEMGTLEGMLFIYDAPRRATFWMRNTLIPLDMLFAGPDGEILSIHADAIPLDETTIDGGSGISHVLEINGGLADRLGIAEGDVLQHPSFGNDALKPCG